MESLIVILVIALLIGLLTRSKGDSLLDTLGSGCSTIVWIIIILAVILFLSLS